MLKVAACPGCGGDVEGRRDKKWCSEPCRGANRDKHDYNSRYYAARKAELSAEQKKWRSENRERVNRKHREWVARNREHVDAYQREYQSRWQVENRLLRREYSSRRRARIAAGGSFFVSERDYSRSLVRGRGACTYCDSLATEWDHVVPLSRGGRHSVGNLVPSCLPCNRSKGSRTVAEWRFRRTEDGFDLQSLTVL